MRSRDAATTCTSWSALTRTFRPAIRTFYGLPRLDRLSIERAPG